MTTTTKRPSASTNTNRPPISPPTPQLRRREEIVTIPSEVQRKDQENSVVFFFPWLNCPRASTRVKSPLQGCWPLSLSPLLSTWKYFVLWTMKFTKKNFVLFYSANRDHPVQGVRRQEFGRPLWSHHLWRLQGLLPEVAKFRRQLPMPAPKELRRRSRQPQPMPILSAPKMPGTRHVQRWQVSFFCTFMSKTRKLKKTREKILGKERNV